MAGIVMGRLLPAKNLSSSCWQNEPGAKSDMKGHSFTFEISHGIISGFPVWKLHRFSLPCSYKSSARGLQAFVPMWKQCRTARSEIYGEMLNVISFSQGRKEMMQEFNIQRSKYLTLLKTDISPTKALLKRIFLFLRWDIFLVSWRVAIFSPVVLVTVLRLGHFPTSNTHAMWSLAAAWSLGTRNALEADFGTHGSSPSLLRQVFLKVLVNCFTDDNDFLCLTPTQPTNIKTSALEGVFSYEKNGFSPLLWAVFRMAPPVVFFFAAPGLPGQ